MAVYPARYKLPPAYCLEIGRIVTRFAYIEFNILACAYALMQITPKQGRVAVRLGRIEDALTNIEDLAVLSGLGINLNFKPTKKYFKELENWRNKLAHGIWLKHKATKLPVLQITRGIYQDHASNMTKKARLDPLAGEITLDFLRQLTKKVDDAAKVIDDIAVAIDTEILKASQQRSP